MDLGNSKLHIVFIHHGGHRGGGFLSLLYLLEELANSCKITLVNTTGNKHVKNFVEKLGIEVIDFEMMRAPHPAVGLFRFVNPINLYSYLVWRAKYRTTCINLRILLLSLKPTIVHLNSLTLIHYAKVPKTMNIPTVMHIREHATRGILGITKAITSHLLNRNIDHTIYICKDYLYEYGKQKYPYSVIYNPVPESKFRPIDQHITQFKKELGIKKNELVLFFPGGTNLEMKGVDDFIEAIGRYKGKRKLCVIIPSFQMLATDALRNEIKHFPGSNIKNIPSMIVRLLRTQKRLKLSNAIRSIGENIRFIFPDFSFQVEKYYAVSNIVFVLHKIPHYSRSVLESGAMKKPIIAYDTPGVRELLFHGLNSIIVRQGNIEGLIDALEFLASNEEEEIKLGQGGERLCSIIRSIMTKERVNSIYNKLT